MEDNRDRISQAKEKLKNILSNKNALIRVDSVYDSDEDEYEIIIYDKNVYYSQSYLLAVSEIEEELWEDDIYNVYFTFKKLEKNIDVSFSSSYKLFEANNTIPDSFSYGKGDDTWQLAA